MPFPLLALAAGSVAAQAGSSAASTAMNYKAFKKNLDWQKTLAHRQVQFRVQDMRKAGINPILAVSPGAGAGGGSPVPGPGADLSGVGRGISSALDMARIKNDNARVRNETSRTTAEVDLAETRKLTETADQWLKGQMLAESGARENLLNAQTRYQDMETKLRGTLLPAATAEMELDQTSAGEWLRKLKRAKEALTPFVGGGRRP